MFSITRSRSSGRPGATATTATQTREFLREE
jgi:hypothetical protein